MTRRILWWTAAALVTLLALLAGSAWFALRSERGLREVVALVQHFGGGTLRFGTTQGRLLGEFVLDDIHYVGRDGTRVDLRRLHLRLRPRELWSNRLRLELAEAQGLDVWLPPPNPNAPSIAITLPSRLPLDLLIDAFTLRDFQLHQPGVAKPFRIAGAGLTGSWIGDEIDIARLDAESKQTGPLLLSAKARMSSDHLSFSTFTIKGPGEIEASGTLGLGKASNDLKLSWRDLRWPLDADLAGRVLTGVNGGAKLSGPLDRYRFELSSEAVLRKLPIKLTATGEGDLQQVRIADLTLNADQGSARIQGKLAWAPLLRADLKGTIAHLDPALFGAAAGSGPSSINGRFDTQTTVQNGQPDIAFSAKIDKSQLRGYPLSLSAEGDTDTRGVRLKQLLLQSGKGSLSATGAVGWQPVLRADLQAQLANFDPAQFLAGWGAPCAARTSAPAIDTRGLPSPHQSLRDRPPPLPLRGRGAADVGCVAGSGLGSINGSIVTQTTMRGGKPDIGIAVSFDHSQLRGNPLTLTANADFYGDTVVVQKLALAAGATRLEASGQATPPFDFGGKLDSPNLAALDPQLGGRAVFEFRLQGPLDEPHLVSKGHAEGLRYQSYRVAAVSWDADVDPARQSHFTLDASEAQAGLLIHSLKLSLTGQETYHHAQLEVASERGDVGLALDGGYDRRQREWGGQLSSGRLAPTDLPPWALDKAAGLLLGAQRQSLEPACFTGNGGHACLRLEQNVSRAGLRLTLDIERLLLAAFKPLLPQHYEIDGELSGSGDIEIDNGDVAAVNADLRTQGVRIQAPKAPAVRIEPSTLKIDDQDGRLHAVLDLRLLQGSLNADLSAAPAADFQARPLSGRVQLGLPDLGFLQSFVPELQAVGGSISGELQFGGSVALPRLQGQIALNDGHAKVTGAGIDLQQVQLRVTGKGEGPLAIDGSLASGGGTLAVNGTLDPSVAPPRADLNIKGQDFQAMATPDARIWVTPQLHLLSDAGGIRLDGTLTVPKAEITPQGLGDNGVAVSGDQVIVGAEPIAATQPLKVYSTITVTLGDAVDFRGLGLTTRLEGGVTVNEELQRVATGQGELRLVEGHYKAYGQDLSIETGRLIFDGGAITRPAVDLYATRHPQADITVGVRVRGTLDQPLLTLQSEPSMPREQQLSWLVLGRSLDQSSSSDRSAVSQAALSLGLSGGDYFAQKIGKSIGVDQISLGQGPVGGSNVAADASAILGSRAAQNAGSTTAYTSQAAQLTLGKYLTPRLFISYGVSLFQPGQTFRLLYDIGHGFKLQTESGVASGGDLIYTFERGH